MMTLSPTVQWSSVYPVTLTLSTSVILNTSNYDDTCNLSSMILCRWSSMVTLSSTILCNQKHHRSRGSSCLRSGTCNHMSLPHWPWSRAASRSRSSSERQRWWSSHSNLAVKKHTAAFIILGGAEIIFFFLHIFWLWKVAIIRNIFFRIGANNPPVHALWRFSLCQQMDGKLEK